MTSDNVTELAALCTEVNMNYKRMAYEDAQKAQPELEARIKEIGQQLYDTGGHQLMLDVHGQVAQRVPLYRRYLEGVWGGIGQWRS